MSTSVVVLDNGGGLIKAGIGGESDPSAIVPNCQARLSSSSSSKKWLTAAQLLDPSHDLTSAAVRRPIDRGHLINPDLQREIWSHLFSSTPAIAAASSSSLLLTLPLFPLPSEVRSVFELAFEDFSFRSLFLADSPSLVHLYEASCLPDSLLSKAQCSLVVDCGFSSTHAAPVLQNCTLNYAVKRIDLGGKALTNYLKELVSYRSVNVMDETFLMDHIKEKLCFVSLDFARDLQIARNRGKNNVFKTTYVLPDGVTHMKGFVKDPEEAKRYLTMSDGTQGLGKKEDIDQLDVTEKPENRSKTDLAKNEFSLTNERFLVPEMIFHPADIGMNQAGLAECIIRAVNSCHPYLHPVLYGSIILTGGSTLFPRFAERLEKELRPLVPDDYEVKIAHQKDPITGVWRGGSLLASSPNFESMCVSKSEYEEQGSTRCRRRFFL